MRRSRSTSLFLSIVALAACGHARDTTSDSARAAATDSAPPATAPSASAAVTPASSPASDASAPITVADVDAWQKGMQGELEAVRQAAQQRQSAKNPNDTLKAMFAANEASTRAAGAKAAGVSEARYQYLSSTLSPVVGNLSPLEMSTKDLPASVVQQMQKSHEASAAQEMSKFTPDVQAALRQRAPELRKQSLDLAGARLNAAGATQ